MTSRKQRYLGSIIVGGALMLTYFAYLHDDWYLPPRAHALFNLSFFGLIGVLVAVLAATTIAGEKDADTWLILLASPLTGRRIISAKMLGIVRRLLWPSVLVFVHYSIFVYSTLLEWNLAASYLWIIFTFSSLWMATGIYLSLRVSRATGAVILNLLLPIMLYGSAWIIWSNFGNEFDDDLPSLVRWAWPLTYLHPGWQHNDRYALQIAATAPYAGIVHLLLAALVLTYTIGRFDAIVGRSPVEPFRWSVMPRRGTMDVSVIVS